jgi:hypothetical protein
VMEKLLHEWRGCRQSAVDPSRPTGARAAGAKRPSVTLRELRASDARRSSRC